MATHTHIYAHAHYLSKQLLHYKGKMPSEIAMLSYLCISSRNPK